MFLTILSKPVSSKTTTWIRIIFYSNNKFWGCQARLVNNSYSAFVVIESNSHLTPSRSLINLHLILNFKEGGRVVFNETLKRLQKKKNELITLLESWWSDITIIFHLKFKKKQIYSGFKAFRCFNVRVENNFLWYDKKDRWFKT